MKARLREQYKLSRDIGRDQVRPSIAAGVAALLLLSQSAAIALKPDVLRSTGGLPPHIVGQFRDPISFQHAVETGEYYVFDRRGHTVYAIDKTMSTTRKVVQIGQEEGHIIDPTAFDLDQDGSFVVADAPQNRERVQIFTPGGSRFGGFFLPARASQRIVLGHAVLNGIGSLQYTGRSILINQPETGVLVTEYELGGAISRSFGRLRRTGQEGDRDVHLALNSGLPLVNPQGGFYFVFQTGEPIFRKYDATGNLIFERHIEGREIDDVVRDRPTSWPRRRTAEGSELPLVLPVVRTAAVDHEGNVWVAFTEPYTYVYDPDGDKIRVVQFRGAGIISPSGMFFTADRKLLVTPGCYEFQTP